MPSPDATPAASPTQPQYGFTGVPLPAPAPQDDGSMRSYREKTPDGGYILWQEENVRGQKLWMPQGYNGADKRIEA